MSRFYGKKPPVAELPAKVVELPPIEPAPKIEPEDDYDDESEDEDDEDED